MTEPMTLRSVLRIQLGHLLRTETREHFVTHRKVVYGRRDDDSALFEIVLDEPLVRVEVRVPRVRVVLHRIERGADPGQPGVVERRVIGTADIAAAGADNTGK